MQDLKAYKVINAESKNQLILTCEHASNLIPEQYHNLGLPTELLDTHIARDKGCGALTEELAQRLGCCAFLAGYSRLFIDYNRRENEDSLIVAESDEVLIPGNQNITEREKKYRLNNYYRPYYQAIFNKIAELEAQGLTPRIFSIHGFTPQLKGGKFRPWNAGVLFYKENPFVMRLFNNLKKLSGLNVDANVPYDMRQYNTGAAVICTEQKGLENALIEIRDTEFDDMSAGVAKWSDILAFAL